MTYCTVFVEYIPGTKLYLWMGHLAYKLHQVERILAISLLVEYNQECTICLKRILEKEKLSSSLRKERA